jgi:hypothetical protein
MNPFSISIFALAGLLIPQLTAAPVQQTSPTSRFVIQRNAVNNDSVITSPEKQSIGVVFPERSRLHLVVPPDFPYRVGAEVIPREPDLAWITISNKSGLIDCIVISKDKTLSFASQDIIDLLKKNEIKGKQLLKDLFTEIHETAKEAKQNQTQRQEEQGED